MRAVEVPGEAVVIRFRPVDPAAVLGWAQKAMRHYGTCTLSVYADAKSADEDDEGVRRRLLHAAELDGINVSNNPKVYVCTSASELLGRGFAFSKDEDENEVPEHYSIDLGPGPTLADVTRFLEAFTVTEKTA